MIIFILRLLLKLKLIHPIVTFDSTSKECILECFGYYVGEFGYIRNKDGSMVKTPNHDLGLTLADFAGVIKGDDGKIELVTGDLPSIVELADKFEKRGVKV